MDLAGDYRGFVAKVLDIGSGYECVCFFGGTGKVYVKLGCYGMEAFRARRTGRQYDGGVNQGHANAAMQKTVSAE